LSPLQVEQLIVVRIGSEKLNWTTNVGLSYHESHVRTFAVKWLLHCG